MNCADCFVQHCQVRKRDDLPAGCPMLDKAMIERDAAMYHMEENEAFYAASIQSMGQSFGSMPRVIEAVNFCRLRGYKKIGVAYCSGMLRFGRAVSDIFKKHGFTVSAVGCKTGGFSPEELISEPLRPVRPAHAAPPGMPPRQPRAICNPIGQALFLNEEKTEFNVVVGLCVGHDSLFLKYAEAPCTIVVLKDRLYMDCCAPSVQAALEWEFKE